MWERQNGTPGHKIAAQNHPSQVAVENVEPV
jgi:hypothetical protein